MTRFRLLCLWLAMLALPLQGLAAASMLYCGAKADSVSAAPAVSISPANQSEQAQAHDHSAHQQPTTHQHTAQPDDNSGHKCMLCAFCGQAAALNEFAQPLEFGPSPRALPPEPLVLIQAVAVLVPDKPPRA